MSLPQFGEDETFSQKTGTKLVAFDFSKKDIFMKSMIIQTLEGKEAIKNKIEKFLKTDKKLAAIYKNSNFGISKESIIGKEYYSHISEVEALVSDIKNSITKINGVTEIIDVQVTSINETISIAFEVETVYGTLGGYI